MKKNNLLRRKKRVRFKLNQHRILPYRLTIYRSNTHVYAQIIDDDKQCTLLSANSIEKDFPKDIIKKTEKGKIVGQLIGKRALDQKINHVIFDKGGYKYHGCIKEVAEEARKIGLKL